MDTRHFDVDIDLDGIAARLGLVRLDAAPDLKEKLALPSSVSIREKKGRRQLILRLKLDYDVTSEKLITFLTEVAEGKL